MVTRVGCTCHQLRGMIVDVTNGEDRGLPRTAGQRRVTSVDVAREAGVSRTTVSYVLNETPNQRIPEATRDRVWEAVRTLDYAPSAAARALRSGRSDVVIWLMPDWPIGPGIGRTLDQLTPALEEVGLTLVVHTHSGRAESSRHLWRSISPRAVIVWELPDVGEVIAMQAAGAEVILALTGPVQGAAAGVVTLGLEETMRRAGRLQAEYLASRGHRRIGYAYPDDPRLETFAGPRLAGARQACAELGLAEPLTRVVHLDADRAAEAIDSWRSGPEPVTAVCAFNDEVASAVLAGLRARELRAPTDLAVVGLDNLPAALLSDPPLTSVQEATSVLVTHIVQALLAVLTSGSEPAAPGPELTQLVVRRSA